MYGMDGLSISGFRPRRQAQTYQSPSAAQRSRMPIISAIDMAHGAIKQICAMQNEILAELGVTPGAETDAGDIATRHPTVLRMDLKPVLWDW